jgi:hypothetical protein
LRAGVAPRRAAGLTATTAREKLVSFCKRIPLPDAFFVGIPRAPLPSKARALLGALMSGPCPPCGPDVRSSRWTRRLGRRLHGVGWSVTVREDPTESADNRSLAPTARAAAALSGTPPLYEQADHSEQQVEPQDRQDEASHRASVDLTGQCHHPAAVGGHAAVGSVSPARRPAPQDRRIEEPRLLTARSSPRPLP